MGTALFITVFLIAYLWLLKHPVLRVTIMPLTVVDRLVAFRPAALPIYMTLWLYVSIPPALLGERRELEFYGLAIGVLCLAGLGIFVLWPTAVPPPAVDWARYPDVAFLKAIDAAGNACPSLHVATALFSCLWLQRIFADVKAPPVIHLANWLWCLAIVYSTMAIKQHVFLDVVGGTVLGAGGAWWWLHRLETRVRSCRGQCGPATAKSP